MKIVCVGINHQTAPLEIREKVAFKESTLASARSRLRQCEGIQEAVILSTCNRVELYMVVQSATLPLSLMEEFIRREHTVETPLQEHLYYHEEAAALEHLLAVTCGLNSLVLGETEILGQVKDAYEHAQSTGDTGKILNRAFQKAFQSAKHIRTHTGITRGQVSTATVAVSLAGRIFGDLTSSRVLVIGAGEIGEKTARAFQSTGIAGLTFTNRTREKAEALAGEFNARVVSLDQWTSAAADSDIIVSSTSSPDYMIRATDIEPVMKTRRDRPLFLIDMAVPRDIDPNVNLIDNCYLYNIDDLQSITAQALEERRKDVEHCQNLIREKVRGIMQWIDNTRK